MYTGGFVGSIGQLTAVTELSTPFVNGRAIFATHNMQGTFIYTLNGIMMMLSFFVFRLCF